MSTLHLAIGTLTRPLHLILLALYGVVHSFGLALIGLVLGIKAVTLLLGYLTPGSAARRRYEQARKDLQRKFENNVSPDFRLQELELQKAHGLPANRGLAALLIGLFATLLRGYGYFGLWYVLICSPDLHGAKLLWIPDLTAPDPKYGLPLCIFVLFAGSVLVSRRNRDSHKSYNWFLILLPPCWAGLNAFLPAGLCFYHLISFWLRPLTTTLLTIPDFIKTRFSSR